MTEISSLSNIFEININKESGVGPTHKGAFARVSKVRRRFRAQVFHPEAFQHLHG